MFDNFKADMDRHVVYAGGKVSRLKLLLMQQALWATAEFRFSHWVVTRVRVPVIRQLLKWFSMFWHKVIQITTGIDLAAEAQIGKGLYIGHYGGILLGADVKMGENCNLSPRTSTGYAGRGDKFGAPTIGDRVFIATGAVVVGKITIGNDVVIGANAVVTKDVPDMAVVGGVPAKIISYAGSADFIGHQYLPKTEKTEEDVERTPGEDPG